MAFEVGDYVRVKETTCLGNRNPTPEGLRRKDTYRIWDIRRSIDGAYDWDDLFLEGKTGSFCEFDFEKFNDIEGEQP